MRLRVKIMPARVLTASISSFLPTALVGVFFAFKDAEVAAAAGLEEKARMDDDAATGEKQRSREDDINEILPQSRVRSVRSGSFVRFVRSLIDAGDSTGADRTSTDTHDSPSARAVAVRTYGRTLLTIDRSDPTHMTPRGRRVGVARLVGCTAFCRCNSMMR